MKWDKIFSMYFSFEIQQNFQQIWEFLKEYSDTYFEIDFFFGVKFCQRKKIHCFQILFAKTLTSSDKIQTRATEFACALPISISLNLPYLSCSLLGLLGPPWLTLWSNKKELSGFTILKCCNLQTWVLYLTFPCAFSCPIMGEVLRLKVVWCTHDL